MTHRTFEECDDPVSPDIRLDLHAATDAAIQLIPTITTRDRVTVIRGYLSLIAKFPRHDKYLEECRKAISLLIDVAQEHKSNAVAVRLRSILRKL